MTPRTYVIGLPVVITVHDDGTVEAQVDLSEASDLDDGLTEVVDDELLEADVKRVRTAVDAGAVIVGGGA